VGSRRAGVRACGRLCSRLAQSMAGQQAAIYGCCGLFTGANGRVGLADGSNRRGVNKGAMTM
jgi:hypothetical protein